MNQEIKQVTKIKNPKRVAASKKSYQERMLKMKKEILENAGSNDTNSSNDGSNDIKSDNDVSSNATNDISGNSTNNTKSNNDVYFYGIGLSILVLGGFLIYYNFNKIKPQSIEINTQPKYIGKCYNIKNDLCSRTAHSYV